MILGRFSFLRIRTQFNLLGPIQRDVGFLRVAVQTASDFYAIFPFAQVRPDSGWKPIPHQSVRDFLPADAPTIALQPTVSIRQGARSVRRL